MPELPEVETIRQRLLKGFCDNPSLIDQSIRQVSLLWSGSLATPDPLTFTNFLPGQKVVSVERRAKFIYLVLSDAFLVFHLRMSGDLYLLPTRADGKEPARNKIHDRLWIDFESGWRLVFNDVRKFGRIWLLNDLNDLFSNLGPEPLDASLTNKKFQTMLKQKSRLLKPLLLDQSFIAGIGNIYSDEALFMAGLHPLRKSDSLTKNEAKRLLEAIRTVLSKGIDQKGASIDWVYRGGDFQNHFQVYQQTGNPCPKCGRPIEKIRVGQRGTHLCTRCQKLS